MSYLNAHFSWMILNRIFFHSSIDQQPRKSPKSKVNKYNWCSLRLVYTKCTLKSDHRKWVYFLLFLCFVFSLSVALCGWWFMLNHINLIVLPFGNLPSTCRFGLYCSSFCQRKNPVNNNYDYVLLYARRV